jgi:hypothetical protein
MQTFYTEQDLIERFGSHNGKLFHKRMVQAGRAAMMELHMVESLPTTDRTQPERATIIPPDSYNGNGFIQRMQTIEEQFMSGHRQIGDAIALAHNQVL